jgi:hypothetical protein
MLFGPGVSLHLVRPLELLCGIFWLFSRQKRSVSRGTITITQIQLCR